MYIYIYVVRQIFLAFSISWDFFGFSSEFHGFVSFDVCFSIFARPPCTALSGLDVGCIGGNRSSGGKSLIPDSMLVVPPDPGNGC